MGPRPLSESGDDRGIRNLCFPSCSVTPKVSRPHCTPRLQKSLHAASQASPGLQAEARCALSDTSMQQTLGLLPLPLPSTRQRQGTGLHMTSPISTGLGPGVSSRAGLALMEQWERLSGKAAPPEVQGCSSLVIQQMFR